jgi:hypothetical protein
MQCVVSTWKSAGRHARLASVLDRLFCSVECYCAPGCLPSCSQRTHAEYFLLASLDCSLDYFLRACCSLQGQHRQCRQRRWGSGQHASGGIRARCWVRVPQTASRYPRWYPPPATPTYRPHAAVSDTETRPLCQQWRRWCQHVHCHQQGRPTAVNEWEGPCGPCVNNEADNTGNQIAEASPIIV